MLFPPALLFCRPSDESSCSVQSLHADADRTSTLSSYVAVIPIRPVGAFMIKIASFFFLGGGVLIIIIL